jgi:glycosyltransferase involved in cell wall biosynthesis
LTTLIALPLYNEEKNIGAVMAKLQYGNSEHYYDILVVNDGSTDLGPEIAKLMGATVIDHDKNLGYGAALHTIFKYAKDSEYTELVTLDSDGQHDPLDIPQLLKPIKSGELDICIGSRFMFGQKSKTSALYNAGIGAITSSVSALVGDVTTDAQSGFRGYNRKAINLMSSLTDTGMGASVEILVKADKAGLKFGDVPIVVKSSEKSRTDTVKQGVDVISSLVENVLLTHPLQYFGVFSALMFALCAYFGGYAVEVYLQQRYLIPNYTLLAGMTFVISLLSAMTALILYVLSRLKKELK